MRSRDNDTRLRAESPRQIGDGWRWHRSGKRGRQPRSGKARLQRGLQHIAGNTRIFTDNDFTRAMTRQHFPAAQPSLSTKSGVMGALPTRPRIPSVPKYLRLLIAFVFLCRQSGFYHPHRLYGFFDVMDANDLRALHRGNYRARKAAVQTV